MLKKSLVVCLVIVSVIIIYLWLVNWSIYYRIGSAGLKAIDIQNSYIFNKQTTGSSSLIYVALGDSLTAGAGASSYNEYYPYLIAERLADTATQVSYFNYSYLGAKTSDLINNLLTQAIVKNPDVVTILIGTNDVYDNISKTEFQRNYEIIITEIKTKTKAKINIISIPNIGVNSLFLPPFNYYYQARTANFNKIIKELTIKYNLNYIDLTTPTAQYTSKMSSYYSADGFHPSSLGYKYWSKIIYDNLNK
ncbi:MAG: SGNH/GDSL hydrolase family protein [Patescibacteria group bacterium]|jgi:lysophospholipase L1-like esterase